MEDNEHSLLGNQVADIKQMNDGTLWISTYLGGVSIFNLLENTFTPPAQAIFTRITASNDGHGLSSPNAQSIIQDSFGNIWIATIGEELTLSVIPNPCSIPSLTKQKSMVITATNKSGGYGQTTTDKYGWVEKAN